MEFKFGIQDNTIQDGGFHWKDLDIEKYRIERPIVICFGGNGTVEDKDAIAIAKSVKRLIGSEDEIDLLSISYSHANNVEWGYLSTNDEIKIVENLFMPLVIDKNGKRLSYEQARKNARRVNLVGHCAGAREFIPDLNDLFVRSLVAFGYNREEIHGIASQILVTGYVGSCKRTDFSYVNFKSVFDGLYARQFMEELMETNLAHCKITEEDKYRLEQLKWFVQKNPDSLYDVTEVFMQKQEAMVISRDNMVNVYTGLIATDRSDHHFDAIDRKEQWIPKAGTTKVGNRVSLAVGYAIAYSVANSINNERENNFIPLDLNELSNHIRDIVESDYDKENGSKRER